MAKRDNTVIGARDFWEFHPETQKLIIYTAGDFKCPESIIENPDIIRLAKNLSRSEAIKEAANHLLDGKPLFYSPIDFLLITRDECLRPYHEESFLHLMRMQAIFRDIRKLWEAGKFDTIMKEFVQKIGYQEEMFFSPDEWLYLEWAHAFHDFCKMAYTKEFWDESGTFNEAQRKALPSHARWFFYLGEMFAVPKEVVALSVLHHFRNQGYPDNGVVKANQEFLNDPKFMFMLGLLTTNDVYEAMTGKRSYRDGKPHEFVMNKLPSELTNIETDFMEILEITKEELFPGNSVISPMSLCA